MIKRISNILFLTIVVTLFFSCGPTIYNSTASYRSLETEVINQAMDGTVTLKVYGEGLRVDDAIDQAMKNAINEIAFKGVVSGNSTKNVPALFRNPNIRLDNQRYFDQFFQNDYRSFVELMTKKKDLEGYGSRERVNIGVLMKVNVSALRSHFQRDGLLK